jgi:hypothetical protein
LKIKQLLTSAAGSGYNNGGVVQGSDGWICLPFLLFYKSSFFLCQSQIQQTSAEIFQPTSAGFVYIFLFDGKKYRDIE